MAGYFNSRIYINGFFVIKELQITYMQLVILLDIAVKQTMRYGIIIMTFSYNELICATFAGHVASFFQDLTTSQSEYDFIMARGDITGVTL